MHEIGCSKMLSVMGTILRILRCVESLLREVLHWYRVRWFRIRIDIVCANGAVVCRDNHKHMVLLLFVALLCSDTYLQQSMTSNHIPKKIECKVHLNRRLCWAYTWSKLLITCGFNSPLHRL